MPNIYSFLRFHIIRRLERKCHPERLCHLLTPVACVRAAFKKRPSSVSLPATIGVGSVIPGTAKSWQNYYLNGTLSFFPERLAAPEWLKNCSFSGLDPLLEAQARKQPVVIAICHFGPNYLLRIWLRAAGVRAATMIGGQAAERSYLHRLKDSAGGFPNFPSVFYSHQLREVKNFLADGNVLIIAVDTGSGNQIEVPLEAGFRFPMATGALRLAAHEQALLFPCTIVDQGRWRFSIALGRPVPGNFLLGARDFCSAGKHLLDEMLPCFRAHPEQCSKMLLGNFQIAPPNNAKG
jgi:lauroyl/myristoyl acyltransferase